MNTFALHPWFSSNIQQMGFACVLIRTRAKILKLVTLGPQWIGQLRELSGRQKSFRTFDHLLVRLSSLCLSVCLLCTRLNFLCRSFGCFRELKKPRRRRRGQLQFKNEFIFYLRISRYPKVIYFVYLCQKKVGFTEHPTKILAQQVSAKVISSMFLLREKVL